MPDETEPTTAPSGKAVPIEGLLQPPHRPMPDRTKEVIFEIRDGWYARARAREMSLATLPAFLKELSEFEHCYSTIVYALAAGAMAACWAVDREPGGGITGFQGGAVMWEFVQEWGGRKPPLTLLEGDDLLYPQYEDRFTAIPREAWEWLQAEATKNLAEHTDAHPDVRAHWQTIVDGTVPFGLKIRDR